MKKMYLCFSLLIFAFVSGNAQTIIKGNVNSDVDGMSLPGVSIVLKSDSTHYIISDFDGNYELNLPVDTGVLVFSYLGYNTSEIEFKGSQTLDVTLIEGASELDEVLLIGYGSTKKGDATSAIATLEGIEEIAKRPIKSLSDFMQGNAAGVNVLQQGGDPSSSATINIRGLSSINASNPLIVVDGSPYYGALENINPNTIESVSILKDAASASIYGAQAQSGVIVIQTKTGKLGKPKVKLDYFGGISTATNLPKSLNAEQQNAVYNLAADNGGTTAPSAFDSEINPWGAVTRTDYMDAIFRTAAIYNISANVSGASEKASYATSFGYNKSEGVLVGTESDRYTFRLKTDYDITDKIKVGANVGYSLRNSNGVNTSSSYSGVIMNAIYMPSATPIYNDEGGFNGVVPDEYSNFAGAYGDVYNPMELLLAPTVDQPANFLQANAFLEYEILDGFSFRSTYSINNNHSEYKAFTPARLGLGRQDTQNYLTQRYTKTNRWIWDNQLSYKKTFGFHNLEVTAINSAYYEDYEYFRLDGEGFSSEEPYNQYMENADQLSDIYTDASEVALSSMIGRLMYNYDNKYYVSGSVRRDETSKLAENNQDGIFSSASVGWRISKEEFFKVSWIDDLKFRASWGQVGNVNALGAYAFNVPLSTTTVILGDENGDPQNDTSATYEGQQSNPNLEWETSESIDVGFDASLFDNHVSVTMDYFQKTTKNMIFDGLEDSHQGTDAAKVNGGELKNTGFEVSLGYNTQIGEVGMNFRGNMSFVDNELVNLEGYNEVGIDYVEDDAGNGYTSDVRSTLYPYRSAVGQELFSYNLIPYLNVFQSQDEVNAYTHNGELIQPNAQAGDLKFEDTNNDGTIDSDDRVYMGSYQPDFTYAFNFNFDYKGFDLGLMFQGVSGSKVFNGYKLSTYSASLQGYNLDNRVLNAWSETNTGSEIPIVSSTDDNQNFSTNSSWYLEDGDYLRLKNINLGYTFAGDIMPKSMKGSSLRVFVSADNVFTITKYSGMDPEVGGIGLDVGRYPISRTITGGISLSF
ncbi:TonB-dependent receptor [uncultured Formosa sp.]|uniref:SusC/RagA family TonB-linked outer membrane protein n=1 Tax=uncultured Formosa sp. TaxID=255435 RepID=UPI00262445C7|nr:TonB-dependent receptor [uncultured Formosa sp.]